MTVPQAVVDHGGFKVLVGAQTHDHAQKNMHKRMVCPTWRSNFSLADYPLLTPCAPHRDRTA